MHTPIFGTHIYECDNWNDTSTGRYDHGHYSGIKCDTDLIGTWSLHDGLST